MLTTSETTSKLDAAIAKAQAAMQNASKDATNVAYQRPGQGASKYATLASVLDVVRPAFAGVGVSFTQWPETDGAHVSVVTRLAHDGEWMQGVVKAKAGGDDPQKVGSAITYLRRYGAMAAAGIAPDDDDDGNAASKQPEQRREPRTKKETPEEKKERQGKHHESWTNEVAASVSISLREIGTSIKEVDAMLEGKRPHLSNMPPEQRAKVLGWLRDDGDKGGVRALEDYRAEKAERDAIQQETSK